MGGEAGALIATNEDGINSPSSPAARGSFVILFGTGAGVTNPPGDDGVRYIDGAPSLTVPIEVLFERGQPLDGADALAAEVLYVGGIPGVVAGLFQIVVRVPQEAATGPAVLVYVSVGRARAQPGITLSIR